MSYTLTSHDGVVRNADNAFIPPVSSNADWQAYQEWLAAGNTPTPYTQPSPDPRQATGKQIFAAMSDIGFSAAWASAVTGSPKLEDVTYFTAHYADGIPETNPKIGRLVARAVSAGATGLTVAALFDKAVTEPVV